MISSLSLHSAPFWNWSFYIINFDSLVIWILGHNFVQYSVHQVLFPWVLKQPHKKLKLSFDSMKFDCSLTMTLSVRFVSNSVVQWPVSTTCMCSWRHCCISCVQKLWNHFNFHNHVCICVCFVVCYVNPDCTHV